jgi:glycosyltransferase involved in cell wall biosynthesis
MRIHQAMLKDGIHSCFVSLNSQTNNENYFKFDKKNEQLKEPLKPILTFKNYCIEKITKKYAKEVINHQKRKIDFENKFDIKYGQEKIEIFSTPFSNFDITTSEVYQNADVIHMHWVAGYVDYPSFFDNNKKPIVWTLHDENPIRGGFHYENDELENIQEDLKTLDVFYKKVKFEAISKQENLIVICPSKWLTKAAIDSCVFKDKLVKHIYYTLDQNIFKPLSKDFCREFFNLPSGKNLFMFVAQHVSNKRKGFDFLLPIIEGNLIPNAHYLIVGENSSNVIGDNITFTNTISDERIMAMAYSAVDFFVLPSREDNLPNTMLESISCGTPVIAFNIGDNASVIGNTGCGIICNELSSHALLETMKFSSLESNSFNRSHLSNVALNLFSEERVVAQYKEIYYTLLKNLKL